MDIKIIFAIVGTVISVVAFLPYIRDVLKGRTKPHMYTWFIWVIVQGIATAGILYGGGKWGALELSIGTVLVAWVFILSLKFGTKNITKIDTISLLVALGTVLIWLLLKNAILAVVLVTVIDIIGYVPTIRKTYHDPWSETLSTWTSFTIGNLFSVFALKEYNLLTLTFIISTTIANAIIAVIILVRRSSIPSRFEIKKA
jgi:hypothetical protein